MSVQDVYDFENIIEEGAAAVFMAAGLEAATTSTAKQFQTVRPRVECVFRVGSEATIKRLALQADGGQRNAAWKGELSITAITSIEAEGKQAMASYRSEVRSICATLGFTVNNTDSMDLHKIQFIQEAGTSYEINPGDGYEKTTITFNIEFSVQANAWPLLGN